MRHLTDSATDPLETEISSFPLVHHGIWSVRAVLMTGVPVLVFQLLLFPLLWVDIIISGFLLIVCWVVVGAIGLAAHVWTRRREDALVLIRPGRVSLPRSTDSNRSLEVPYSRIFSIERRHSRKGDVLLIGIFGRLPISYTMDAFTSENSARDLQELIEAAIGREPNGGEQLRAMRARRELGGLDKPRPFYVAQVIAAVQVAIFFWVGVDETQTDALLLMRHGSLEPQLIEAGEWFRIATGTVLHDGSTHLLGNMCALFFSGWLLESTLGRARFVFILLASALGGAAGSFLSGMSSVGFWSVGFSGAISGLIGALAYLNIRYREQLPVSLRWSGKLWALIGVSTLAIELSLPNLDSAAHALGFVAGAAALAISVRGADLADALKAHPLWLRLSTGGLALFFVAAAVAAIHTLPTEGSRQSYYISLLRSDLEDMWLLNDIAWEFAVDPDASSEGLSSALDTMTRVVAATEDPADLRAVRDTLATLQYRLGDLEGAILNTALSLTSERDARHYASQLARFEFALSPREPRPVAGLDLVEAHPTETDEGIVLDIDLQESSDRSRHLYAVIHSETEPLVVIRYVVGAGGARRRHMMFDELDPTVFANAAAVVARVLPCATAGCEIDGSGSQGDTPDLYKVDPDILNLP